MAEGLSDAPAPAGRPGLVSSLLRKSLGADAFGRLQKWRIAAAYARKNLSARLGGSPATPWVCEFGTFDPARSNAYARSEYRDYLDNAGLDEGFFAGKSILEIGPGENLGVAMRFLLGGAARVVCVDRFPSLRPAEDQMAVYRLMDAEAGAGRVVGALVRAEPGGLAFESARLLYLPGLPAERLEAGVPAASVDAVISRAVLEHLSDPAAALKAMDAALKAGGLMLHEIDLRDHGMFSAYGLHPLTFLTFPERVWKLISSHIGAPNRWYPAAYAGCLEAMGYRVSLHSVLELGAERRELRDYGGEWRPSPGALDRSRSIRGTLSASHAGLSDRDLTTAGVFLVARKPG